jgi:hypothetical protein
MDYDLGGARYKVWYLSVKFDENIFFALYYDAMEICGSHFHDRIQVIHLLADFSGGSFAKERKKNALISFLMLPVGMFRTDLYATLWGVCH